MTNEASSSYSSASGGVAARLKLERLKRSWTQEHLAEAAHLSVRTVQRLESGEDPSAETLRTLAEALGVDVAELRAAEIRRQFGAPLAASVKWITVPGLALLIGGSVVAASSVPWLHYLLIAAILLTVGCSVRGYSVRDGQLWIHRPGWSARFPLPSLTEISINPRSTMGAIRLFGSGGMFGYLGFFRNQILGRYRSYVTDPKHTVVLRFKDRCIVISPDDPAQFQAAIKAELAATASIAPELRADPG